MRMMSWFILEFNKLTSYYKHNIGGKGYNYKFNIFFLDVWYVINANDIECTYISFITSAHHEAWLLMKFEFCQPIEFESVT